MWQLQRAPHLFDVDPSDPMDAMGALKCKQEMDDADSFETIKEKTNMCNTYMWVYTKVWNLA